jgi:hypothetical protein
VTIDTSGDNTTGSWTRLDARPDPSASETFAAGGALIALSGVVAIGVYIGIGNGFSGTAAFLLTALAVIVAYVIEWRVARPFSAACTAVIAVGIPIAIGFSQWPFHGYSDVRTIELLSVIAWLAVFLVGGTRGRAVLLGLALFVALGFAIGEAANLDAITTNSIVRSPFTFGASSSVGSSSDFGSITGDTIPFDSQIDVPSNNGPGDRTIAIGITAGLIGAAYLFGVRRSDRLRRTALGVAFVLPGVIAVIVAVVAFSVRVGETWFAGALSLVVGLGVAWVANERRRFLTWTGTLGAAFGVLLVAGDTTTRINSSHTADGALHYGILALLFGLAAVLASLPIAALLHESVRLPAWLGPRRGGSPPPPPAAPPSPPVADLS